MYAGRCVLLVVLFAVCSRAPAPAPAPARAAAAVHSDLGALNKDIVTRWANELGNELWNLTMGLTKADDLKSRYISMNVRVQSKEGSKILSSAVTSVGRMLQRKIDAVKCIHERAEQLAREYRMTQEERDNFTYCSAKYSYAEYPPEKENHYKAIVEQREEDLPNYIKEMKEEKEMNMTRPYPYRNMTLNVDSHFYNIPVTTDHSCVQVPTNIYDQEDAALEAILWSEALDETFDENYKSDPSLSWQYFGSASGILRFYPGMPWRLGIDKYDCRVRSWYIEAATCSKDVVVLFDVSGSMTGFRNYVARQTLDMLLSTLSNNDYVNVYYFRNETKETVECFQTLVQATPENIMTILDALNPSDDKDKVKIPLEGYANLTTAYIKAFKILKERRLNQSCSHGLQGCNQLVMLITDYVPGNLTEVFETYNREYFPDQNDTFIPVRVFTYLIGKEVTNVREIQWMACLNRGYYVHIHSVEEVQQQVLKYINVIARPMILQGDEAPPTWTHANIDETRTRTWGVSETDINKPDADKLVTSVGIPAFDYKANSVANVTSAKLLGVAGTDVPIDSIAKLAQPHQLGVNGYSFIVSNNGYLLLHPWLITSVNGELQKNYNSVDIVEVEQVDDGRGSRELGPEIETLRREMVNGSNGNLTEMPVLYHYDDMRRIARVKQNYFYAQLEGTPFSMGISLPQGYGNTSIEVGDILEIKHADHVGINVTDFFKGSYRVHPEWVYCKYHYLEGHEMDTPEQEIWHFLERMGKEDWEWREQYPPNDDEDDDDDDNNDLSNNNNSSCKRGKSSIGQEAYYCNKDLVQNLIFDAKLTSPFFGELEASDEQMALAATYNASVRFIATSSSLTRWHYIFDRNKNEVVDEKGIPHRVDTASEVFGDIHKSGIEETWYVAAVLQHDISPDSLVVSTPLPQLKHFTDEPPTSIVDSDGDITVTASYSIFPRDGGKESPASVVGLQFSYKSFFDRFSMMTSKSHLKCDKCIESCNSELHACYVVDSSGYIVLSEDMADVGSFFGNKEPWVMSSLYRHKVFTYVDVYNYQALCSEQDIIRPVDSAGCRLGPWENMKLIVYWMLGQLVNLAKAAYYDYDMDYVYDDDEERPAIVVTEAPKNDSESEEAAAPKTDRATFSCDEETRLYIMNQTLILENDTAPVKKKHGVCSEAYWGALIPKTNLMLIAVDHSDKFEREDVCKKQVDTRPRVTPESIAQRAPCHKVRLGGLSRRRLEGCFTYHPLEKNIDECGLGSLARANLALVAATFLLLVLISSGSCP